MNPTNGTQGLINLRSQNICLLVVWIFGLALLRSSLACVAGLWGSVLDPDPGFLLCPDPDKDVGFCDQNFHDFFYKMLTLSYRDCLIGTVSRNGFDF
jgi:hypothetical protein